MNTEEPSIVVIRSGEHGTAVSEPTSCFNLQDKLDSKQITFRATIAGLIIGSVILISNFQFGLQTGWVSMMSLPSALLGFAAFKLSSYSADFTDVENVFVQSVAVAVGTGPLAYGLIGIVPAIENFLTKEESGLGRTLVFSLKDLFIWSMGLAMFGVFFAIPLRKQVIVDEKLPFPSGSATATLISVLHNTELNPDVDDSSSISDSYDRKINDNYDHSLRNRGDVRSLDPSVPKLTSNIPTPTREVGILETQLHQNNNEIQSVAQPINLRENSKIVSLMYTFAVSATYTLLSYFFPFLKSISIFGTGISETYKWNFQPSPAYIGQGIIMGLPTVSYMLFGAILGWGALAPLSKSKGWAPGDIDDWKHGGQGWILWISLSVMISDSLVSFFVVTMKSLYGVLKARKKQQKELDDAISERSRLFGDEEDALSEIFPKNLEKLDLVPPNYLISTKIAIFGVLISSIICLIAIRTIFGHLIPYYAIVISIILALLFSILGVRALGETDLNPVSGIGKLSQLIFALVIPKSHPSKVLINLVAGGIAEAGAQQAGDLMQDLKTGHLLGASPKAQFVAQVIGTVWSVILSSVIYLVYNKVYTIPSKNFRIPTAIIWIDCARLVTGEGLPPKAFEFSIFFGIVFGVISILKNTVPKSSKYNKYLKYLPSGIAVGIGIYNTPNFTLARFLGGVIAYCWTKYKLTSDGRIGMIIFSSGLVLGEGLLSAVTMIFTSVGIGHF